MKSLRRSLYGCIVALSLLSGIGLGCDALFRPFLEPSPQPCAAGCPVGQTCNADTQLCESPADLGSDLAGTSDGGATVPTGLSLVAGGLGGYGNADDTGSNARFSQPTGMASDGNGLLYVSDTQNHCIRKISTANNAVSTLAGSCGESGTTNSTGTNARFSSPKGLALDGAGNLFIADSGNHVIRKLVLATQTVSTFSGSGSPGAFDGAATTAQYKQPSGIALGPVGFLLVADTGNHIIRKLSINDGTVVTLAGTAGTTGAGDGPMLTATFNQPTGITMAMGGPIYVTDMGSHLLRKLDSMNVATVLGVNAGGGYSDGGPGVAQFRSPAGLFVLDANTLLLADTGNHLIRRITLGTTANATTLAGGPGAPGAEDGGFAVARFNEPSALVGGGGGMVFVADRQNHVIRALDLNANSVSTSAGLAPHPGTADGVGFLARFNTPLGIGSDEQGNLYIADAGNHTIRKINQATGSVTTIAGTATQSGQVGGIGAAARFFSPWAVVGDGAGSLYISDTGNHAIRKLDLASGTVTTLAGNLTNTMATPGSSDGDGTAASFYRPVGLAYDGQGSLFVADSGNNTLRQIAVASGRVTTVAGMAGAADNVVDGSGNTPRFSSPYGVACDRKGNVYVSDLTGHVIRKVVVATRTVTTLAGTAGQSGLANGSGTATRFNNPQGLAIDLAGVLYVADSMNHAIRRIDLATANVITYVNQSPTRIGVKLSPLPGRVNYPRSVLWLDGTSGLILTDAFENAVLRAL